MGPWGRFRGAARGRAGQFCITVLVAFCPSAAGHAYLLEPPSRNILAHKAGRETCPHCLQANGPSAVQSRSQGTWPTRTDPGSHGLCGDPVQGSPEPMSLANMRYMEPTQSQRTYTAGAVVEFVVGISTHHWGHFEFRICDRGLDGSLKSAQAGQDCLNSWVLHRAPRLASCGSEVFGDCQLHNAAHPERWYTPPPRQGTQTGGLGWLDEWTRPVNSNDETYIMRFVIPEGLECESCTLQWYYTTGNNCAYDEDYLNFDPGFKFWAHYKASWATAANTVCGPGGTGAFGEEFWNCADIKVLPPSSSSGTTPSPPVPAPGPGPLTTSTTAATPLSPSPSPSPPPPPSPARSPVARHGFLRARGNSIVDEHGQVVQLRGMSFFWSQYGEGSKYYTRDVVYWLRKDWQVSLLRAAMGIEGGGYLSNKELERSKVEEVCDAAIEFGLYVIIDWHDHNADQHVDESKEFFGAMAQKYGHLPNVLFETFNEPVGQSWSAVIKPYHEQVIQVIRAYSSNLVILGTKTWSQDVDEASRDPVSGKNLAYTLHFYANTHKSSLRDKASTALANGIPLFVTEWGTCSADGNGNLDLTETQAWLDFLTQHGISDANWAINDKLEMCAALRPGSAAVGGWHLNDLTESGSFLRQSIRAFDQEAWPVADAGPTPSPSPSPFAATSTAAAGPSPSPSPSSITLMPTTQVLTLTPTPSTSLPFFPSSTPSPPTPSNNSDCDSRCKDIKISLECASADATWRMCALDDTWWHFQCQATCSRCASGLSACKQPAGDNNGTVGDTLATADCDASCSDLKAGSECQTADEVWSMCSTSDTWWHGQCMATCSKCASGLPACSSSTGGCDVPCKDLKPSAECKSADQVWRMCSGGGDWWHRQCKATCSKCPPAASAACTSTLAPSETANSESLLPVCDLHCRDAKPEAECQQADLSWAMCSLADTWWHEQCKSYCGTCFSTLVPCSGKDVPVTGAIAMSTALENPETAIQDAFVIIAMKGAVAAVAGSGVDASRVVELTLNFTANAPAPGGSFSSQRRLQVAGLLAARYAISVPQTLSSSIASALSNQTAEVLQISLASMLASVGINVSAASVLERAKVGLPIDQAATTSKRIDAIASSAAEGAYEIDLLIVASVVLFLQIL